MADMQDFDIELQDDRMSDPEHFNGNVASAGTPVTITPTNSRPIQLAYIMCNSTRDPDNSNNINDAIKFSLDGGSTYSTLMSGESQYVPGVFDNIKIDASDDGVYYQIIVWS